jgi:hypothetical protein
VLRTFFVEVGDSCGAGTATLSLSRELVDLTGSSVH